MLSQHFPDLDFSREIVTAYYRQFSSDFSINSLGKKSDTLRQPSTIQINHEIKGSTQQGCLRVSGLFESRPIHIDSAKVGCGEVQVIWAEYDREWSKDGSGFKSGARYEVRIPYAFWMAHQASLELEQYLDNQVDTVVAAA
jgi:hypothetical protein